jgi:integrase
MPAIKLTDAAVQRLKAPPGGRVDYFDAAFPGLSLRVTGSVDQRPERRTWTLFYRIGGRQRRLTFEPGYPALSLAEARAAATQAQLQIKAGLDPAEVKATLRKSVARPPDTVAAVVESFIRLDLERRKRAPRYIADIRKIFSNHVLPRWTDRDVRAITRRDVIELLDAIMDTGSIVKGASGKRRKLPGGPVIANRTLAAVRAMFNWALRRGIVEATPAAMVEAPGEETARARVLEDSEIVAVWAASSTLGYPFGPFFQLALLLGQRREEIAHMQWGQIDQTAGVWSLPTSKSGRAHMVPLAPMAVDILSALPTKASRYVFTTSGDTPISGFSKAKRRLDQAVADTHGSIAPWTIHDLRRSCATTMGRLGMSRFIVGKVLNHADHSVTGIYDRHEYLHEKRHALEMWAQHIDSLTRPLSPRVMLMRTSA